jgi:hypothetical protein
VEGDSANSLNPVAWIQHENPRHGFPVEIEVEIDERIVKPPCHLVKLLAAFAKKPFNPRNVTASSRPGFGPSGSIS